MRPFVTILGVLLALSLSTCAPAPDDFDAMGVVRAELTPAERLARATIIRDTAAANGLSNGVLLGGIADSETGMAHCWSEATWACQGPWSDDCAGPVIAGAGDGPCDLRQGGLGMFQFDGGTYDDTLAREGDRVLSISGNVEAAVDFVVSMVVRSTFIDGVDSSAQALAWMNEVRVDNELWDPWITTVTAYYNGCWPGSCSVYDERWSRYSDHTIDLLFEMGEAFWYDDVVLPECEPLGPEGGIIDEVDICFEGGGDPQYLREVTGDGWNDTLIWTHATDHDEASNYGLWNLELVETGRYAVDAYTDADWAESVQSTYQVFHEGVTDRVLVDQTAVDGWSPIGEFTFAAGTGQWIRLDDNTGEPGSTETRIVLDAIRLVRVDHSTDGDADADADADGDGDVDGDGDGDAEGDGGWDDDGGTYEYEADCECLAAPASGIRGGRGGVLGLVVGGL